MQIDGKVALALTYTVLGSTLGGYGLWYLLIKEHPISKVTPYSLLTPVFGILAGWAFFAEPVGMQALVGAGLTIFGIAVIVMRRPRLAEAGESV